jgi:GH25 family lysozyme M1 (1,4-beta-N-acetylmuramidase)
MFNWDIVKARFLPNRPVEQSEVEVSLPVAEGSGLLPGADPQAFLNDADFFDNSADDEDSFLVTYGMTANLVLSSTEKDLRIHIVDILGRNISGEEFAVLVDGVEYRDSDHDGLIYIKPLNAGECTVELLPRLGYRTQAEPATIYIRQQIEYVAMNALDFRILTESQIDVAIEDTTEKEAYGDRDASEYTEVLGSWSGARLGIDVSKWNKEIDWMRVKEAGVQFAIIRIGYRGWTSGSLIEDPYFQANIRGAIEAGIPVGVYFFTQAINVFEAVEEASMVISMVKDYRLDYPIFIDVEGTGSGGQGRADHLDTATRTEVVRAFIETIRSAGYNGGVYSGRYWFYNNLDMSRLSQYVVWLAEYRDVPLYTGYYQIWQYTSKGRIDGIEGFVDLNLSYMD